MFKKITIKFLILLAIFSSISLIVYLKDRYTLHHEYNLKMDLDSTDLSTLLINNHRLGEKVGEGGSEVSSIQCESEELVSGGQIEDCSTEIITWYVQDEAIFMYRNETLTIGELRRKLGNNFIEDLPISNEIESRSTTITYVDKQNNIEFTIGDNRGYDAVYLKRIDDNSLRISNEPILNPGHLYNPLFGILLRSPFNSPVLFNPWDFISLPIYFSLLLLPTVLTFTEKNKSIRKRLIVITISLAVLYIILLFLTAMFVISMF